MPHPKPLARNQPRPSTLRVPENRMLRHLPWHFENVSLRLRVAKARIQQRLDWPKRNLMWGAAPAPVARRRALRCDLHITHPLRVQTHHEFWRFLQTYWRCAALFVGLNPS